MTGEEVKADLPDGWHNHAGYRATFNAALQGICANPVFFGAIMQGSASAAVEFAQDILRAAIAKASPAQGEG